MPTEGHQLFFAGKKVLSHPNGGKAGRSWQGSASVHTATADVCVSKGQSSESPFTFFSVSASAGCTTQAAPLTSEAADAAMGFWFF